VPCLDALDQGEIICGCDVVVLVGLEALASLLSVEAKIVQSFKYFDVNRHGVEANYHALHFDLAHDVIPNVAANFFDALSFAWVDVEDILY